MDYNIYIHNVEETKPTTPKKPKEDKPTKPKDEGVDNFNGVLALAKSLPIVAGAIAVAKMADNLIGQYLPFQAQLTGDYRSAMAYSNFKNALNYGLHPFSGTWGVYQQKELWRVENERRRMNAELLGDTEINKIWRGV